MLDAPKRMLTRVGAAALPSGMSNGIACDGESIWLLSDDVQLRQIDFFTGEILQEFTLDLSVAPGVNVNGIEIVDGTIWISIAGNENSTVVVDPKSGKRIKSFSSPTMLGPSDLAISEEGVWVADGTGGLFLLDRVRGTVLWGTKLAFPERDHGIAIRGDIVVIGNVFGGVWMHRRDDLSVIAELVDENGQRIEESRVGPMCFQGDHLRVLNGRGVEDFVIEE